MPRLLSLLAFLAVVALVVGGGHYYIWARLVRDVHWSRPVHRALTATVVLLGLSVPANLLLTHVLRPELGRPWVPILYVWLGLAMGLPFLLGVSDLSVNLLSLARRAVGATSWDPPARLMVHRIAMSTVAATVLIGVAFGLRGGLAPPTVKTVEVRLRRLPLALDGFVIVQLTDLHIGPTLQREFVQDVVARTNALKPDLVAITGDLADGYVPYLRPHIAPLRNLRARYGTHFVTGNHEYYGGVTDWILAVEELGINVLRNQRVSIGEGANSFDLIGIDDEQAGRFGNGHAPDLERAVRGRDSSREAVLLAHQPLALTRALRHGIGLLLTGHTHGGQVWPFGYLVRLQQPLIAGLTRIDSLSVYTSSGTGHWGPPLRLFAPLRDHAGGSSIRRTLSAEGQPARS